jgi:hypothetical protein
LNDRIADSRETPVLSLLLGYGAMVPFAAAAAGAWLFYGERAWFVVFAALWGCAILCFLAGVRRGVSFRMAGGPTLAQIATMLVVFGLGFCAMSAFFLLRSTVLTLAMLAVGYALLAVLDPIAARHGEAPLFFAGLRPAQMAIAVVSLVALIVRLLFQ